MRAGLIADDAGRCVASITFAEVEGAEKGKISCAAALVADTVASLYSRSPSAAHCYRQGVLHILRGLSAAFPLTASASANAATLEQFLNLAAPFLLRPETTACVAELASTFTEMLRNRSPALETHISEDLLGTDLWPAHLLESLCAARIADARLWAAWWAEILRNASHLHDSTAVPAAVSEQACVLAAFLASLADLLEQEHRHVTGNTPDFDSFFAASFYTWDDALARLLARTTDEQSAAEEEREAQRQSRLPLYYALRLSRTLEPPGGSLQRSHSFPLTRRRRPDNETGGSGAAAGLSSSLAAALLRTSPGPGAAAEAAVEPLGASPGEKGPRSQETVDSERSFSREVTPGLEAPPGYEASPGREATSPERSPARRLLRPRAVFRRTWYSRRRGSSSSLRVLLPQTVEIKRCPVRRIVLTPDVVCREARLLVARELCKEEKKILETKTSGSRAPKHLLVVFLQMGAPAAGGGGAAAGGVSGVDVEVHPEGVAIAVVGAAEAPHILAALPAPLPRIEAATAAALPAWDATVAAIARALDCRYFQKRSSCSGNGNSIGNSSSSSSTVKKTHNN